MNRTHAEAVGPKPTPGALRAPRSVAISSSVRHGHDRPRFRVDIVAGSDKLGAKVRPVQHDDSKKNDLQLPARGLRPVVAWMEREAQGRRGHTRWVADQARTGA